MEQQLNLKNTLADLVKDGLVSRANAEQMYTGSRTRERAETHPLLIVSEQNWSIANDTTKALSIDVLMNWLAGKTGMSFVHIDPLKVDVPTVCATVSHAFATRYRILPLDVTLTEVVIATADPYAEEWIKPLEQAAQRKVRRVLANPRDIVRYLAEFYSLARSVKGAAKDHSGVGFGGVASFEQLLELGKGSSLEANDQHIVHIVDWLLQYAFEQRASDIHLEPRRTVGTVRFRIDGVMHMVYQIPAQVMNAVTNRIKLLGRMDIVEKRRPQDGRIKTQTPTGDEIELRLSTMPTVFGEKLVMRIFAPDVLVKSFRELGLGEEEEQIWTRLTSQPNGIVLLTGPTGSGKTSTLYTTMKMLATPEINACTIEDPIEMVVPQLNQMQVQPNIGLHFADGVRTLLRQDPDIIMIGEIRDKETAEMAIQAALTGHLVLSTLHTNDAPSAITRLLEIGIPSYLINATLLGVVGQRLPRTLCSHCKSSIEIDEISWEALVKPWRANKPAQISKPNGCLECRMTGYRGRVGIYEMLVMTPSLRKLIHISADIATLRQQAMKEGMKPLRISGAIKVAAGITTVEEIISLTPDVYPEE